MRYLSFMLIVVMLSVLLVGCACADGKVENESTSDQANVLPNGDKLTDDQVDELAKSFTPAGKLYGERKKDSDDLTKEISFSYDEYGRISVINYIDGKNTFASSYIYDDKEQKVYIYSFYESILVNEKSFDYKTLSDIEYISIIDGYYVCNPKIS